MYKQDSRAAGASSTGPAKNVRVLHALNPPDGRTRYIDHMLGANPPAVQQSAFSWREALIGRYEVIHVHWPENFVKARNVPLSFAKAVMAAMLVVRLAITRTPVVRTLHNLAPHETPSVPERLVLQAFDRLTTHFIRLNPITKAPEGRPVTTILHGHYRSVYPRSNVPPQPKCMLYFGIIRPYKGVENLIDKFAQMPGADARLRIVGKPQTDLLRDAIKAGASGDSRIELKLEFVPDTELAKLIEESAIVVLPYHEMHNSGAALLALSLDRPVLAPATAANVALRREVGERWLHLYDGPALETKDLEDAYAFLENGGPFDRPNLSGRDWDRIGESHSAIYHGLAGNRRFKR